MSEKDNSDKEITLDDDDKIQYIIKKKTKGNYVMDHSKKLDFSSNKFTIYIKVKIINPSQFGFLLKLIKRNNYIKKYT
jgi:hypothetical protein